MRISTRLLDGTYPDYRQLIPDHYPNRLHLGKESLLGGPATGPAAGAGQHDARCACRCAPGGVDLTVVSQEVGDASETVDGDFTGEDLVIAFNPSYLIDGVEAVLGDEVLIETADAVPPGHRPGGRARRLPVPADAGAGLLSARPAGAAAGAGEPAR